MKVRAVLSLATIAAAAAAAAAPAVSVANVIPIRTTIVRAGGPLPQRQVRTGVQPAAQTWHAIRPGPHVFYGTIAALRGPVLTIRLRSGRVLTVDASAAIANGNYSAPLFVGKLVSIDGDERGTTFMATHIFRVNNLANLRADR